VDEQWALHAEEEPIAAVQQLHLEEEAVATVCNSGLPMQAPKRATGRRRRPRSRERRSQCSPRRPGRPLTFACLTGDTVPAPGSATTLKPGRETRRPGACKRRCSWPPFAFKRLHF
jgi:hypothetical protein